MISTTSEAVPVWQTIGTDTVSPAPRRLAWLDAIRGLALFGVILVHTNEYAAATGIALDSVLAHSSLDIWVDRVVRIFFAEKAQTLFSIMFGISFALQFQSLRASYGAASARTVCLRRLTGLLFIGVVDMLMLPTSDILNYYAIAGFLLLATTEWRPSTMLVVGSLLTLVARPTEQLLSDYLLPAGATLGEVVANGGLPQINQVGTYAEITVTHWHSLWFVDHMSFGLLGFLPYVLGRFLLGSAFLRSGVVTCPHTHASLLYALALIGVPAGLLLTLSTLLLRTSLGSLSMLPALTTYLVQTGTLALALGYLAALHLAWFARFGRAVMKLVAPVGRMALTNYLLQGVFNSLVFFGFGLGLMGRLGSAACALLGLTFFLAQCGISHWWLARHVYGPVEWLWRAWTYRMRPAWRRRTRPRALLGT